MIYSASRRTDMPAFFPDLLTGKVSRSRKLEAIVFWTKDIRNLVQHPGLAGVVERVPSVVQYTVTGLAGTVWEPGVPPLGDQVDALRTLASRLPQGAVRWRFDPILPDPGCLDRFRLVKSTLEDALGYPLDGVTVSFPDPYRHAVARAGKAGLVWPRCTPDDAKAIISAMVQEFPGVATPVALCCEPELLALPGVTQARCVDGDLFTRLYGLDFSALAKDKGQRTACGCVQSTDIGEYAMACRHGCTYCYARPEE